MPHTDDELPKEIQNLTQSHHVFVWNTSSCTKYAFGQPMPTDKQKEVDSFKAVVQHCSDGGDTRIYVAFRGTNAIPNVYWTYFTGLPPIYIAPYWPWVGVADPDSSQGWKDVMRFPDTRPFGLHPRLIEQMLAVRPRGWADTTNPQPATLPPPIQIATLMSCIRFRDGRQYLAYVIGSLGYEEEHNRYQRVHSFNGMHVCEIYAEPGLMKGSRKYLILVNPQPQTRSQESDLHVQTPSAGEQVQIILAHGGISQVWQGTVVAVPPQYRTAAVKVAILAYSQPFLPPIGRIEERFSQVTADFFFGHHGQNTLRMKENIVALMMGKLQTEKSQVSSKFIEHLVLSQDLWHFSSTWNAYSTAFADSLKAPYKGIAAMTSHINKVCAAKALTPNQISTIQHYFTHVFTEIRGPPGTGKSTIIDTMAQLEHDFEQQYWICTESNAACDVLVEKAVKRTQSAQPPNMLRIRTAVQERVDYTVVNGSMTAQALLLEQEGHERPLWRKQYNDFSVRKNALARPCLSRTSSKRA